MSRILFTWELGDNLGHIARYLPLAKELRQRGHTLLFAIRDNRAAETLLAEEGFACVPAPAVTASEATLQELLNYADILSVNGFGALNTLAHIIDGWLTIFYEFQADAVVAQSAPSSLMAAHFSKMPVMRIDCGFGCPPDESPFPCFRPWLNISNSQLLEKERTVLHTVNQLCVEKGCAPFSTLQDIFKASIPLLLTFPELDHYTGRTNANYYGPIFTLENGVAMAWNHVSGPRIFVYLRPFEGLSHIFTSLASNRCNVIAFVPGAGNDFCSRFSSTHITISTVPVKLADILPAADIVISHGGHGLASACLQAGVPMLLVPQVVEQLMTVYNFERLGIGKGVTHDVVTTRFEPALRRMVSDLSYRENSGRLSHKYAGYAIDETIKRLCSSIETFCSKRKTTCS